jgi:hypothetical protein
MTWNHRIVRTFDETYGEYFELAEVFYDSGGEAYAYGGASINGDTVYSLTEQVERFKRGLEMPILEYPKHFTGDVNK